MAKTWEAKRKDRRRRRQCGHAVGPYFAPTSLAMIFLPAIFLPASKHTCPPRRHNGMDSVLWTGKRNEFRSTRRRRLPPRNLFPEFFENRPRRYLTPRDSLFYYHLDPFPFGPFWAEGMARSRVLQCRKQPNASCVARSNKPRSPLPAPRESVSNRRAAVDHRIHSRCGVVFGSGAQGTRPSHAGRFG